MAATPAILGKATLDTLTTLYTVGTGKTTILKSIDVANFSNASVTIHVYVGDDASSAVDGDHIICEQVAAGQSYGWEGEQVLLEGMTLQAAASAGASCALRACGVELS